jgi:hypothetical protein
VSNYKLTIEKNDFAKFGAELGIEESLIAIGQTGANNAKSLCPVDFGQLANSIMWASNKTEGGFNELSGGGGGLTPGGKQRQGTGNQKASSSDKLNRPTVKNIVILGTNSDHWYPEYGTRYQIAQPFLRPGLLTVIRSGKAAEIANNFSREAMQKAFLRKKQKRIVQNG